MNTSYVRQRTGAPEAVAQGRTQITYNGRTRTARTADGVEIVEGLRVYTNDLERGVIRLDRAEWEWYGSEGKYHLWFEVEVDHNYKGEPVNGERVLQSDDRVATRFEGVPA